MKNEAHCSSKPYLEYNQYQTSKKNKVFCELSNQLGVTEAATHRGVPTKRCSENMQQIYRSNFIEITLRHGCYLVNLLHIFRTSFFKNPSGWLLLELQEYYAVSDEHKNGKEVNRYMIDQNESSYKSFHQTIVFYQMQKN